MTCIESSQRKHQTTACWLHNKGVLYFNTSPDIANKGQKLLGSSFHRNGTNASCCFQNLLLVTLDQQARAAHFFRLFQTQDGEDGRCDISKHAVLLLETPALWSIGHDEWYLIGGVGGLRCTLFVNHLFGVTVDKKEMVSIVSISLSGCALEMTYPWSEVMNKT